MAAVSLMVTVVRVAPLNVEFTAGFLDTCILNMISTLFLEEMRLSASSATSIGD